MITTVLITQVDIGTWLAESDSYPGIRVTAPDAARAADQYRLAIEDIERRVAARAKLDALQEISEVAEQIRHLDTELGGAFGLDEPLRHYVVMRFTDAIMGGNSGNPK